MEITSTTPTRRSGLTIVTVIMTVLAMIASALHAPAVGAQEAQSYALDYERTEDHAVMMWLDENQPIVRADGIVVYCYNADRDYPMDSDEWRKDKTFTATKTIATGDVFENSADNPLSKTNPGLLGEKSLETNVLEVLETGYPTDVLGLQESYGLTDAQFYRVTQFAIWYYTDSAMGAVSSNGFTEEMLKVFNILVQAESAESERADIPENLALEMYLAADNKLQHLLSITRVDRDSGEELEEPEGGNSSDGSSLEAGSVAVGGSSIIGGSSGKLIDGILGSSGSGDGILGSSGSGEGNLGSSGSGEGNLGSSGSGDGNPDGESGAGGDSTGGSSGFAKCEDSTSSVSNPVAWLIPLGLLVALGGSLSGVFGPHIEAIMGKFNAEIGKNFPDFGVGGSSVDKPSWAAEIEGQLASVKQQLGNIDPALGSGLVGAALIAIGIGATQAEWDICGVQGEIGSSGSSNADEGSTVGSSTEESHKS